jgi:hypothetical protein
LRLTRPLSLELLENRLAPATWGNPWPDGQHLTLSFPGDGTSVGEQTSVLFQSLKQIAPTQVWQRDILRAFQAWAMHANLNIGLVADQGQAFGASGRLQGDSRFGDFRIEGHAMSSEVVALGTPFAASAGTWAGDIHFNTAASFGIGAAEKYDLFTVALQEAGHALGLGPSNDPTSAMYGKYAGVRSGPSAADIAALHALYGPRSPDAREGAAGNGSFSSAVALTLIKTGDRTYGIGADADITSTKDVDFYRMTALVSGSLNVSIKTGGLSLLTPRVTIYDSSQRVIRSATDTDPLTGELVVKADLYKGRTYYIKVASGRTDAFGVGSYRMETQLTQSVGLLGSLVGVVTGVLGGLLGGLINDDHHSNDSFETASRLPDSATPSRFDHAFQGSISDSTDVDFYRVTAPVVPAGAANVMKIMAWGLKDNGLLPTIRVYDANQQRVPAEVLVNDNGNFVVQLANAVSGAAYYVEIAAYDAAGPNNVGNYFLGIDFSQTAEQLQTIARQTLAPGSSSTSGIFKVQRSELFHLVLSPRSAQAVAVTFSITDSQGRVVVQRLAKAGETVSVTVPLAKGPYLFKFTTAAAPPSDLVILLRGLVLDDPIGPQGEDPTQEPFYDDPTTYWSDPDHLTEMEMAWWEQNQESYETFSGPATEDSYSSPYFYSYPAYIWPSADSSSTSDDSWSQASIDYWSSYPSSTPPSDPLVSDPYTDPLVS